jgi:hypothetical protein
MSEVKETKEAILGALKLGVLLYSKFKDGAQVSDAAELFAKINGDEELKNALVAAYNGADAIPSELKALDVKGALELGSALLVEVPKILEGLK